MQCVAVKPDLLPWDNNIGAAVRGLGISELFAFMLRCAVRQSRQTESEETTTGKLTYVLQSLSDESLRCPVVSVYGVAWPWGYRLGWHNQEPLFNSDWGFRELQGGKYPGKKRSVTALRASSWQVGFLASHANSHNFLLGLNFVLVCFMPRLFMVKYINSPGRAPHMQLRALTIGWLCKGQGSPTCVCLQLGENKPWALTCLGGLWPSGTWRHIPSCSDSGVFGTPVG